jgi:hypothetical protein
MALLVGIKIPIKCKANLVSYFDPVNTQLFGGNEAFITALGYIGITLLKTSHPRGLPL